MLKRICVFCGSSSGTGDAYLRSAAQVGELLAERGIDLVYGGGKVGLMGAVADACLAKGGHVIGVIPQLLVDKEVAHQGLTKLRVVQTMHERKALMADLADAFLALPGGFGTWDELCEVQTWAQIGIHRKASAVLNVNGYYDPLLAMADRAVSEGFLKDIHRALLLSGTDAARLLERMENYVVPAVDKWMNRADR
jgi:uncharacterized protein (TIGR00730 family)